jgi:hypothetical protein
MYRSRLTVPLAAAFVTASAWFLAPLWAHRSLGLAEALLVGGASVAVLGSWRARRLRRDRQKTEELRDSALW